MDRIHEIDKIITEMYNTVHEEVWNIANGRIGARPMEKIDICIRRIAELEVERAHWTR